MSRFPPGDGDPILLRTTVILVAHNLVRLHYPFPEALASIAPLGLPVLVGDFGSNDGTPDVFRQLAQTLPIEVVSLPWPTENHGGRAIGMATERLARLCSTPWVFNLQACEVLTASALEGVRDATGPREFNFAHFFGSCWHVLERGYLRAPRLFARDAPLSQGDGWACDDWVPGQYPLAGVIHRYSYCFDNSARAKAEHHCAHLYTGARGEEPAAKLAEVARCRAEPNFKGSHPAVLHHLLDRHDYDLAQSLEVFARRARTGWAPG